MHSIIDVEGKLEVPHPLAKRLINDHKVLIVELDEVFIYRSLNPQTLLELGLVMDRTCIEEDVLLCLKSEVGFALKIGLSLRNDGEI